MVILFYNLAKIIEIVEDVETLRKICKAMESEIWSFKFKYECAEREIRGLKEENEKLKKLFDDSSEEKEIVPKIDNITIQMGGR